MFFRKFRRANQARFFGVPRAKNNGAIGLPPRFHEFAHGTSLFHQGDQAGNRIFRAVHPGVMMVAANDPLIGVRCAGNFSDHVVNGFQAAPIRFHFQVHFSSAWADVISHAQTAAPRSRSNRSGNRRKQRFRIAIRNRQHRNFCDDWNIFQVEPLCVLGCANARCQRIARINWIVGHATALHAIAGTPRSRRKSFPLLEAVLVGI